MMRQWLTLLCVWLLCRRANHSSLQNEETFGEWSMPVNVGAPLNTSFNDKLCCSFQK